MAAKKVIVNVTTGRRPSRTSVSVGTPISRVQQTGTTIDNIVGIDTTGKTLGSVLVYNPITENFEATINLVEQNINGGQY